jgi:transposase
VQPLSLLAARSAERNLIERSFNKLKRFRRLATRHDRKALYFSSFVYLAASLLWP